MAEPSAAIDRKAILVLQGQFRFQDGQPYDARCGRVLAALLEPIRRWPHPKYQRRLARIALAG